MFLNVKLNETVHSCATDQCLKASLARIQLIWKSLSCTPEQKPTLLEKLLENTHSNKVTFTALSTI